MARRGTAELARQRHEEIMKLYNEGRTLKEIAFAVGLANHTSVWHHVQDDCRCNGERPDPPEMIQVPASWFKCQRCGAGWFSRNGCKHKWYLAI